jgi:hypothetical protein
MQQRLKSAAGSARARIIATEFLNEFFTTAHNAITALDMSLGREAFPTFTTDLESNWLRGVLS